MTMPIRVRVAPGPSGPVPAPPLPNTAPAVRPVPAAVSARTAAAFNMPVINQGSTAPTSSGDEAGTLGGGAAPTPFRTRIHP